WIDTHLASPQDIVEWERAPSVSGPRYRTGPRSVVVLFAGLDPPRPDRRPPRAAARHGRVGAGPLGFRPSLSHGAEVRGGAVRRPRTSAHPAMSLRPALEPICSSESG